MRIRILQAFCLLLAFGVNVSLFAQKNTRKVQLPPGYPDRSADLDVLPGFRNPPSGYGEVSFYWWLGDSLTRDRITWELDQLKGHSITGLQVNYAHSDQGGNIWGLTYPGKPRLFSKDWWELFEWFLKEAQKRDMSVSLSDYTLGIAGQGWYVDDMLKENPGLCGSNLVAVIHDIGANVDTAMAMPDNLLSAFVYRTDNGKVIPGSGLSVRSADGKLLPGTEGIDRRMVVVSYKTVKTSFDPMNPLSGAQVIAKFFEPFEQHCPDEAGKGLNFFFSDELNFGIGGLLWNSSFAEEFMKRKGYDLVPELAALFTDIGPRTPKVRMDYNDVLVALSEENFFRPIYEWHTERGMLYGCDHGGRGLDVTEFGDYFRAQRWMSGPGCDQPVLARNVNKDKVASSIAHLYERPRTWLEGFHSSGWGTSCTEVADATFANFAMGQNLLSLHGLYYSTHGGWWEWAPPDNHFRQPYWADMDYLLKCTERLSYLLSQGYHRCDVAVLYPVTPVVAGMNGKGSVDAAFASGERLYSYGIDYDFIDYESLIRSRVRDRELQVSGERYRVLVLPSMTAMRLAALEKVRDFYRGGGIVVAIGALPGASERIGRNDPEIESIDNQVFGRGSGPITHDAGIHDNGRKNSGKAILLASPDAIIGAISRVITPDFRMTSPDVHPDILHRRAGNRDIYYVYGVPKDTECFFRCTGKVELWNPWDGTVSPLRVTFSGKEGTWLRMPLTATEPQLIVFSPGMPETEEETGRKPAPEEVLLVGDWEFELNPTLDNRYGDYRQPAYPGYTAAEATDILFRMEDSSSGRWMDASLEEAGWDTVSISYGRRFWALGPLPGGVDSIRLETMLRQESSVGHGMTVKVGNRQVAWKPYEFSWRYGLKGNPGRQGYHGLKEWMHDDIIQTGRAIRDWPGVPRPRIVAGPAGSTWYFWSTILSDADQEASLEKGDLEPTGIWVNGQPVTNGSTNVYLHRGRNPVLLRYSSPGTGFVVFTKRTFDDNWKQKIPLATHWLANPSVLPYDTYPANSVQVGWYRFQAPPGLQSIEMATVNQPQVWINGKEVPVNRFDPGRGWFADSLIPVWKATAYGTVPAVSKVAVRLRMEPGNFGGAAFIDPIRLDCGKGRIRLGDLAGEPSLRTYSGGMWYRKTVLLNASQAGASKLTLDLGDLVASAEVYVNGKPAGVRVSPPWTFDVTGRFKSGENRLEILVYNTLGNYFLTVPSSYTGKTRSGLIGPVRLLVER
jgi:hypothetical protein